MDGGEKVAGDRNPGRERSLQRRVEMDKPGSRERER